MTAGIDTNEPKNWKSYPLMNHNEVDYCATCKWWEKWYGYDDGTFGGECHKKQVLRNKYHLWFDGKTVGSNFGCILWEFCGDRKVMENSANGDNGE